MCDSDAVPYSIAAAHRCKVVVLCEIIGSLCEIGANHWYATAGNRSRADFSHKIATESHNVRSGHLSIDTELHVADTISHNSDAESHKKHDVHRYAVTISHNSDEFPHNWDARKDLPARKPRFS